MKNKACIALLMLLISCSPGNQKSNEKKYKTTGSIERYADGLDEIIKPSATIEVLATGFEWAEGPVWVDSGNFLLFSDIPDNRIYKWTEKDSISLYLEPSGYTDTVTRGGEVGSNGLLLNHQGRLVLCQHGNRRIAVMNAALNHPQPHFVTLTAGFEGKRFNSPNDGVLDSKGNLYFTDPPYGLEKGMEDPARELDFQGVYRLSQSGELTLMIKGLSRPNGIGLSPDEKILYVSNSDPSHAVWMAYRLDDAGNIRDEKIFHDATEQAKADPGLPDGLKVSSAGFIFATGPGGIWIFSPEGSLLGKIRTPSTAANCAFNSDESVLYITADANLLRIRL